MGKAPFPISPTFFFFNREWDKSSQDKHVCTMFNFQMSLSPYKLPSFLWTMFAQEHGLPEEPQTEETELLVGKIRVIPISQQGRW